jgi:hypothetical protein
MPVSVSVKRDKSLNSQKYSMSFTTGTLLHRESEVITRLYCELGNWDAVRGIVIAENRLQMRTLNASKRIFREISSRLKWLTPPQLQLLLDGTYQEQSYLLWLAVCRRYRFIYDFAVQVIREKFLRMDFDLSYDDYDIFFNNKAEWHSEVEGVAVSTRSKQRQVIFKMLREAELLSADNRILPCLLSPRLIQVIHADDPADFAIFPAREADIKRWTNA